MADKLPPTISFAGLVGIESAVFTLSRGVMPSRGVVRTPVWNQTPEKVSDFEATYDGVTLTLTDCAVTDCSIDASGQGTYLVITFEDRRWRWQFTEIVGRYNVKRDENTLLYEKTPQELAEMLLDAMGETAYDVTALPNLTRPFVDWRNSRCDLALNELLSALDCDIVPDLTAGELVVVKLGSGDTLPNGPWMENPSANVTYAPSPEQIRVITADARYQCLFELEAVGLEPDGSIVPVAELSYTPDPDGWEPEDPDDFSGVTGTYTEDGISREYRDLALQSVDRWFRIVRVAHDGYGYVYDPGGPDETTFDAGTAELNPPGFEDALFSGAPDIETVEQLLPLLPHLNDTYEDAEYGERPQRPRVYGEWYDDTFESETENVAPGTFWREGFDLDLDKGIVKLPRAVRYWASTEWEPARLYLYAVCQADWVGLNRKVYYGAHQIRGGVGSPTTTLVEERLDIIPKYNARYVPVSDLPEVDSLDVDEDVYDQVDYYLTQMASRLVENVGATAEYHDLNLLRPDGAIEQVQWEFGPFGTTTRASRFTRLNGFMKSYKESREEAEVLKAAETAKRLAKAEHNPNRTVVVRV